MAINYWLSRPEQPSKPALVVINQPAISLLGYTSYAATL